MVPGVTQVSIIPISVTHWLKALKVARFILVSLSAVLVEIAHLIRQHNDANVLVMPGRFIDNNMARKIMDEFFTATFEGGRHQKRVDKIPVQK